MNDTKELYYYEENKGIYVKGGEWLVEKACVAYDDTIQTKYVTDIKNHIIWVNFYVQLLFYHLSSFYAQFFVIKKRVQKRFIVKTHKTQIKKQPLQSSYNEVVRFNFLSCCH
jgi:hypothetical protein